MSFSRRIASWVGVSVFVIGTVSDSFSALEEADKKPPFFDTSIWTDWHLKSTLAEGVWALAKMRDKLSEKNLHEVYNKARAQVDCRNKTRFRQNDGTCNDLKNTVMGAVNTRFSRNLMDPSSIEKSISTEKILDPNPLRISRELLARPDKYSGDDSYKKAGTINVLAAAWIQFQTHDWFFHGKDINDYKDTDFYRVTDEGAQESELNEMILPRSSLDPTTKKDTPGYTTFVNEVTHWWDGSQIYGSASAMISCASGDLGVTLRECVGGRMKMDRGFLPKDFANNKEMTGFNENWWIGLSFLHTLFVRNHNTIVAELAKAKKNNVKKWTDESLFQVARLINAAMMAKIHTVEWTPGILANKTLGLAMNANWYGFEKYASFTKNSNTKTTVKWFQKFCNEVIDTYSGAQRYCEILGGIVGGRQNLYGVPFSMTEEFVAVYRMHSLLPENLELPLVNGQISKIPLNDTRDSKARTIMEEKSVAAIGLALGKQNAGALTLQNFPRFLRKLKVPLIKAFNLLNYDFDMAAVDLMRDRERGVPKYNEFRRQLQLKPIREFSDLMPQAENKEYGISKTQAELNRALTLKMKEIYGNVENIDLLVGSMAEAYRPNGYGFGETSFQVFITMASRRLQADRFYTNDFRSGIYTDLGMQMIDKATMRSLIVKNMPEIDAKRIPENAFAPWK